MYRTTLAKGLQLFFRRIYISPKKYTHFFFHGTIYPKDYTVFVACGRG